MRRSSHSDTFKRSPAGEPWTVKKAVCLHEEDAGIMWKHTEYRTGHAEVRRARRLVLSFVATVVRHPPRPPPPQLRRRLDYPASQ